MLAVEPRMGKAKSVEALVGRHLEMDRLKWPIELSESDSRSKVVESASLSYHENVKLDEIANDDVLAIVVLETYANR